MYIHSSMLPAPRVYLLSPARTNSARGLMLAKSDSPLGEALRSEAGAPLGEVFAFLSSLYFRGKLAYAARFGLPEGAAGSGAASVSGVPGVLVITPGHGLCRPSTRVRAADLAAMSEIDVDAANAKFVQPLLRDAARLLPAVTAGTQLVLLGSIATPKYVQPLCSVFGERLLFPREFIGRGDMSRGGMLLRAARDGLELDYTPVHGATLHGPRARRISELSGAPLSAAEEQAASRDRTER